MMKIVWPRTDSLTSTLVSVVKKKKKNIKGEIEASGMCHYRTVSVLTSIGFLKYHRFSQFHSQPPGIHKHKTVVFRQLGSNALTNEAFTILSFINPLSKRTRAHAALLRIKEIKYHIQNIYRYKIRS